MATYNTTKNVSMIVCFAGHNHRIVIEKKKCSINKKDKSFIYKSQYKGDDGGTYVINAETIKDTNGTKANVIIKSGNKVIAERHNVDIRFSRYLFE